MKSFVIILGMLSINCFAAGSSFFDAKVSDINAVVVSTQLIVCPYSDLACDGNTQMIRNPSNPNSVEGIKASSLIGPALEKACNEKADGRQRAPVGNYNCIQTGKTDVGATISQCVAVCAYLKN